MKKITYSKLATLMYNHNLQNNVKSKGCDKNPLIGVIVFSQDNFSDLYTLEERSYRISSDNKAFISDMCSNSIFGNCLDGKDLGVRIDWYFGDWKVEYCYLEEE